MKKGKPFESATLNVVRDLHPTQEVLGNVKIVGKVTEYRREVDVQLIDPNKYDFMAFECKDHKAKVDVELVEAFITKLKDIGAKKGGIVSNSGFTPSALKTAKGYDVDALALIDSGNATVKTRLFAGLIMEDVYIKSLGIGFSSTSTTHFSVNPNQYLLQIRTSKGGQGTAYQVFAGLWNAENSPLSQEPGTYSYEFNKKHGIQMLSLEGNWIDLDTFEFNYEVKRRYYHGQIEMIDTCGLYDVRNQTYQTKTMITEKIAPSEIAKNWPKITEEELAQRANDYGMRIGVVSAMPEDYMGEK